MTSSQFDTLPSTYEDFTGTAFRTHLETPSVLTALGDLHGMRVLDLGCGSGVYTRLLKQYGAAHATGLDISAGMISHARAQEAADPIGVDYLDGALPDHLAGTFDLVLGVYVLPYATTPAELLELCSTAATALRPGGRFVTLPVHPGFRPDAVSYARYGFTLAAAEPLADASPVTLNLRFDGHDDTVTARYWTRATLDATLRRTGFARPRWSDPTVTGHGITAHGADYWHDYLSHPHTAIIDCAKESGDL